MHPVTFQVMNEVEKYNRTKQREAYQLMSKAQTVRPGRPDRARGRAIGRHGKQEVPARIGKRPKRPCRLVPVPRCSRAGADPRRQPCFHTPGAGFLRHDDQRGAPHAEK